MEIWKDIPNYEGLYQVSDLGRVRSLDRLDSNGRMRKGRILRSSLANRYLRVSLSKDSEVKYERVHSLVADVFLGGRGSLNGTIVVDHINNDRHDNSVKNLRLVSQRENANKKHLESSSEYTGVSWHKGHKKWTSSIHVNKKKVFLGHFTEELRASIAYELALLQLDKFNKILA